MRRALGLLRCGLGDVLRMWDQEGGEKQDFCAEMWELSSTVRDRMSEAALGKAEALIHSWCPPLPPQHRQLSHSQTCPCTWFWEADATLCLSLQFLYTRNMKQRKL